MEGFIFTWIFTLSVLSTCMCSEDTSMIFKMLSDMRNDLNSMDTKIVNNVDIARASFQSELKQVKEEMEEILQGESLDDHSKSNVVPEVRRLKQDLYQMKRQLDNMMKHFRIVQGERYMYRDALLRAEGRVTGSCNCDIDNRLLRKVLKQCRKHGIKKTSKPSNNVSKIDKLKQVLETLNSTCQGNVRQAISSPLSTTTVAPPVTPRPVEHIAMNRLIITPCCRSTHAFGQLNIHTNTLSNYSLELANVNAVCFVERLHRLLVAQRVPARITSSRLDGNVIETLVEDLTATGMAVDEDRELVFMTAWKPIYGISRMSTSGENYTVLRHVSSRDKQLKNIAVNSRLREIYVSAYWKVFVMSYDGRILLDLASGSSMFAITFDRLSEVLYFNSKRVLRKMSKSDKAISYVTTLPGIPQSFSSYNGTLYYGGERFHRYIGAVQLETYAVTEQLWSEDYDHSLIVCLVP